MSNCDGCRLKLFKPDMEKIKTPWHYSEYYEIRYNKGEWDWACILVRTGKQILENCPCSECILKTICRNVCEQFIEKMEKGENE